MLSSYGALAPLLEARDPPCISLYQPTHRQFPASRQNPIRYRNLLRELEATLRESCPEDLCVRLLEPFERLGGDEPFWQHPEDALAAFGAPGFFRVLRVQRPVPELVIVADSLHIKPLVRIVQTTDAYQVLVLDRDEIALYEGNRDALDSVELAPGVPKTITEALGTEITEPYSKVTSQGAGPGAPMHHGHGSKKDEVQLDAERFFRAVDKAVLEQHSQPSGLPLLLAALPEHQGLFRSVSRNPFLLKDGLAMNAKGLQIEELRRAFWDIVAPYRHERTRAAAEEFAAGVVKGLASDRLSEVGAAAVAGRVRTLMVEAERHIPGRVDGETGLVRLTDAAQGDDVLDDIAVTVLRAKGRVEVVPAEHMPTPAGLAAVFRY